MLKTLREGVGTALNATCRGTDGLACQLRSA